MSPSVTLRGSVLCVLTLLNFAFVFITGADFVRFISFRAIYQNITGDSPFCQGNPTPSQRLIFRVSDTELSYSAVDEWCLRLEMEG